MQIKIAPTKKQKAAQKAQDKQIQLLSTETSNTQKSKRNEDLFIGGPLDGTTCVHQPNGPRASNDPKGFWADYYFLDHMTIGGLKVTGFHLYSSARGFHVAMDLEKGRYTYEAGRPIVQTIGVRGPEMRKMYYYCGFIDDKILAHDGVFMDSFLELKTVQ